ncbi:MAG: glycosyltransferase [Oscillospiraceae bacterium]|nr:glycosyltransferase [Oscillospiraceae bacterium]
MISLVIPVYNEEKIIGGTIADIRVFMDKTFGEDYEVIIVDDGSADGTLEIAKKSSGANIKIITHEKNRGKGGAVRTGMLAALGDVIFFTDCDLAYGLDVIREGYEFFLDGGNTDILIGSRRKHKEGFASYSFLRKFISLAYFKLLRIYGGIRSTTDSQSGIKGFRNGAAKQIFGLCECDGWAFDLEVLLIAEKLGFTIRELPVKIVNHGDSKIRLIKDSIKMLKEIAEIKKKVKKIK